METLAQYIARAAREGIPLAEVQRVVREEYGSGARDRVAREYRAETDAAYVAAGILAPAEIRESRFVGQTFDTVAEHATALSNGGEAITRWDAPVAPDQILRDIQGLVNTVLAHSTPPAPVFLPIVPMAFERLEPEGEPAASMFSSSPISLRTGGVMIRYPRAMTYMEGILDDDDIADRRRSLRELGILKQRDILVARRWVRLVPHASVSSPPNPGAAMRFNGRKVERRFLGSLASRYGVIPWARPRIAWEADDRSQIGNRHHAKRWLRAFAQVAAVASDALEGDQPSRCFALLCEHISLEDAIQLAYGPPSPVPMTKVVEYTSMADVERDFGTSSREYEYETAVAIMQRGTVYMESDTPLEIGDLVAMGEQPNRVRLAEYEDRIAGRVEGVTVSGGPDGTRYLALVRVGEADARQHWSRAVAAAMARTDKVTADETGAERLLAVALEVSRLWDRDVQGEYQVLRDPGVTSIVLRARLFGEQVYASVNT